MTRKRYLLCRSGFFPDRTAVPILANVPPAASCVDALPESPMSPISSTTGQTIAQKILARHSGRSRVEPGEHVTCTPDHVVTQELYWPTHKRNLDRIGTRTLARPDKAVIVIDHTPSAAVGSQHAATHRLLKDLTAEMGVENFFGPNTGLRHLVLVERGFARPGSLIFSDEGNIASIGAVGALNIPMSSDMLVPLLKDENWVTVPKTVRINLHGRLQFGVSARDVIRTILRDHGGGEFLQCCIEYGGPALAGLSMDDRQTILASTFHAMSDTAIMDVDDVALAYVRERAGGRPYEPVASDPDAQYERVIDLDLSAIAPMVTVPPEQTGATPVGQVAGKRIHQASIGSCAGNRLQEVGVFERERVAPFRGIERDPAIRQHEASTTAAETMEMQHVKGCVGWSCPGRRDCRGDGRHSRGCYGCASRRRWCVDSRRCFGWCACRCRRSVKQGDQPNCNKDGRYRGRHYEASSRGGFAAKQRHAADAFRQKRRRSPSAPPFHRHRTSGRQERRRGVDVERFGEQLALCGRAHRRSQQRELVFVLDAFGDHLEAQLASHSDETRDDLGCVLVGGHRAHERGVVEPPQTPFAEAERLRRMGVVELLCRRPGGPVPRHVVQVVPVTRADEQVHIPAAVVLGQLVE